MNVEYRVREAIAESALHHLMIESWDEPVHDQWDEVLRRSLTWITAHEGDRLVGFVNVAWDGGAHGFLLDTTVHPSVRRRGIGSSLVRRATEEAREAGLEWLHVDYKRRLATFYAACDFRPTNAGRIRLELSN